MKTFKEFISECELVEGITHLPVDKMLAVIKIRQILKRNIFRRLSGQTSKDMTRNAKMKEVLKNHDPVASEFKELENKEKGRIKRFSNDGDEDIPDEKIRIPVRRRKLKGV